MSKHKGFTLVEMIISLGLFLILLTSLYSLFSIGHKLYTSENQRVDVQQNVMISIDHILTNIRRQESTEVIQIFNGDKLSVGQDIYSIKNNKLYLNKNAIAYNIDIFNVSEDQDGVIHITVGTMGDKARQGFKVTASVVPRN
ncbi:MAG: prepilin-type N-terminal cleavage/methylation domain-containing protein [Clostridia bacterium]|nr:prepilin-type N-terminal cleavage/methylation domain-containing protein [Clostridia bacterium]